MERNEAESFIKLRKSFLKVFCLDIMNYILKHTLIKELSYTISNYLLFSSLFPVGSVSLLFWQGLGSTDITSADFISLKFSGFSFKLCQAILT
jgi:hypothetical protein